VGIVAVAQGDGFRRVLESLGADVIVEGGQTMNPSAETITRAIEKAPADNVFVFPNNKNIIMAAEQAAEKNLAAVSAANWQEYDISFYSLDLTINHVTKVIYGRVGIYGRPTIAALDTVKINLNSVLTVDSVYDQTGNLVFSRPSGYVTVHLPNPVAQGEMFGFTVVYHGTPPSSGLMGFSFATHLSKPLITTLSEPYGAHDWWPCNDITVDKADSVDVIITADTSLVVSSNGLQVSDVNNGNGTHTVYWQERYPIATYLVSIALYPYNVWGDWYHYSPSDSMPLTYFVYPERDGASRPAYSVIPEMISILASRYGEYPFINEKYGCSHFDWGGAMEHQTNTSTDASDWGMESDVVVHELSHQWWGDMVTCADWHHIWINEGFATYSEALYYEALYGTLYYHNYVNNFEFTSAGSIYIQDTTNVWNIFGSIVYDKGGWVLHMLRHIVGDELFFQSLVNYRNQYMWSTATTEQFRDVVETTTGMDLHWFFQEWIYGTYRPDYRYSYLSEFDPAGGWNTYLYLRQAQTTNPTFFTMPIDIKITTSSGSETTVIFNNKQGQNFTFHTDQQPTGIAIDPQRWISRLMNQESYTLHIINDSLADGAQAEAYVDTVQVKGGSGNYICQVTSGAMPAGWTLEGSTGIISGTATEFGSFTFRIRATDQTYPSLKDSVTYSVQVEGLPLLPGDANLDHQITSGDAIFIVNYIFRAGQAPVIKNLADANGDCKITVGDAVYIISYIFRSGSAPVMGCVE
jgi:hypothetical protein